MGSTPPRSPSLEPPRKSVELEDPGAHQLDTSSEDEFSDAREAILSPTRPTTRVELVDTRPSYGEQPGSEAYEKRLEDAQPDVIAVQSEEGVPSSKPDPDASSPVPQTVVTRVDSIPAHGEVPRTHAAKLRSADAEPDIVERRKDASSNELSTPNPATSPIRSKSPIAADGGFGPMDASEDTDNIEETENTKSSRKGTTRFAANENNERTSDEEIDNEITSNDAGDDFGDDFDDFADGEKADEDDFGDFDDHFEPDTSEEPSEQPSQPAAPLPFDVPDFSSQLPDLAEMESILKPHMQILFPAGDRTRSDEESPSLPEGDSAFLTERSHWLWQELLAPAPLQPPNWVRSRIRRLFLVSLGVPVDLDEILPKSKQKRLVLAYNSNDTPTRSGNKAKETKPSSTTESQPPKRAEGPPPPPDFDAEEVESLCKKTAADLDEMSEIELEEFVDRLKALVEIGKAVLVYWVQKKQFAVEKKEAYDGVVESLVRHARRVRN